MRDRAASTDFINQIDILAQIGRVGDLTDGQLLQRFLNGRDGSAQAAFSALVDRHGPMVYRVCRRVLRDDHDSDDAFQATFLILARKAGSVRNVDSVASWLHGVARRVATRVKSDAVRRDFHLRQAAAAKPVETSTEESWAELHEEVARLPRRYREPVVLCYLEGLTTEVAARRLSCPHGTVLSRLARARARLRASLTRRGLGLPASLFVAGLSSNLAMPTALKAAVVKVAISTAAGEPLIAGPISTSAIALVHTNLRGMIMTKLKISLATVLAVGITSMVGLGLVQHLAARGVPPTLQVAVPPQDKPKPASVVEDPKARAQGSRSLRVISLALYQYHNNINNNQLPAPYSISPNGQPLLSWRVAILPFLGEQKLYEAFHLDEPWDSPHNKTLLASMPKVFEPGGIATAPNSTRFQVLVGDGAVFEPDGVVTLDSITDGHASTIMVVQGGEPVPWTKPEDIPVSLEKPLGKLDGPLNGGFLVAMADGSVHFISEHAKPAAIEAAIFRKDGRVADPNDLDPKKE